MLELAPAYGRDYKSKAAVLKDWEDGKDFRFVGLAHTSILKMRKIIIRLSL